MTLLRDTGGFGLYFAAYTLVRGTLAPYEGVSTESITAGNYHISDLVRRVSLSSFSGAAVMAVVRRALAEELVQGGELPAMGVGDGAAVEAFVAGVHAEVQRFFADEETYSGDAAIKAVGDVLRQMLQ